jgi:hypothetical protein
MITSMAEPDAAADHGGRREPERTEPVDLCDERGRLNPAARGWSRRPLHRANLRGSPGRKKRWEYWLVTGPEVAVSITYADVDYLGIASVWVWERADDRVTEVARSVPFARGFALPEQPCRGTMAFADRRLRLMIDERPGATVLRASGDGVEVDLVVDRPEGHETLNVVVPWSDRRFQYTSKHNTRPARGSVSVADRTYDVGVAAPAWGVLDLGRGIWPYRTRWNWAAASGHGAGGRVVGLQFGGRWTEGTGATENGVCVDGRLTKIGDELVWTYDWDQPLRPWRVQDPVGGRVDAVLTPIKDKHSRIDAGVLAMEVHQVFGTWAGRLRTDGGEDISFDGIDGFAEEARNRW